MLSVKNLFFVIFVICIGISNNLFASNYVGLSVTSIDYTNSDSENFDLGTTNIILGKDLNDTVSAEFRYGMNTFKDTKTLGDNDVSSSPHQFYGMYVKFTGQFTNELSPYFLIGHTFSTIKVSSESRTSDESTTSEISDSDFSYGAGLSYSRDESSSFNLEYNVFGEIENVRIKGFSLGFKKNL